MGRVRCRGVGREARGQSITPSAETRYGLRDITRRGGRRRLQHTGLIAAGEASAANTARHAEDRKHRCHGRRVGDDGIRCRGRRGCGLLLVAQARVPLIYRRSRAWNREDRVRRRRMPSFREPSIGEDLIEQRRQRWNDVRLEQRPCSLRFPRSGLRPLLLGLWTSMSETIGWARCLAICSVSTRSYAAHSALKAQVQRPLKAEV